MGELMAVMYDPLIAPLDPVGLRKWRQWAVSAAQGHVLELGVGTGLNLPHYAVADSVTAIDPDGASLRRAFLKDETGQGDRAIHLLHVRVVDFVPVIAGPVIVREDPGNRQRDRRNPGIVRSLQSYHDDIKEF